MLEEGENSAGLVRINREPIGKVGTADSPQSVVLDTHSMKISVYRE